MTEPGRAVEPSLDDGLALLEEQRCAMLARDADRLDAINARLSAWIAGCRNASLAGDARLAHHLDELRGALETNSLLARRSALQASRALGALVAPDSHVYDDEGMTRTPTGRRDAFSA